MTADGSRHVVTGRLAGVVTAVPFNAVASADIAGGVEAQRLTGIVSRRHVTAEQDWSTLALAAGRGLLDGMGWSARSVDTLVVVTQTPTSAVPASGFALHHELGLRQGCPVIEVNWSCSGYVYGLWLAMQLTRALAPRVMLIVGDTTSRTLDMQDRATAPVFGDAVSASAIEYDPVLRQVFHLGTDGAGVEHLRQLPEQHLRMTGAEVFNFTLRRVPPLVRAVLAEGEPSHVLFHQANKFMLDHLVKKCELDPARVPVNIERFGNCSSASIPLLMCDPWVRIDLTAHARLALLGFGAGWAYAGVSLQVEPMAVCGIVEV